MQSKQNGLRVFRHHSTLIVLFSLFLFVTVSSVPSYSIKKKKHTHDLIMSENTQNLHPCEHPFGGGVVTASLNN